MTRLLIALLALAAPSFAFTRGGGSPLTDCLAAFSGTPANRPASRPREHPLHRQRLHVRRRSDARRPREPGTSGQGEGERPM
jgi:hypothetical protein